MRSGRVNFYKKEQTEVGQKEKWLVIQFFSLKCSALSVGLSAPLILTLTRLDKSAIIDGFSNDLTGQSIGREDFVDHSIGQ